MSGALVIDVLVNYPFYSQKIGTLPLIYKWEHNYLSKIIIYSVSQKFATFP